MTYSLVARDPGTGELGVAVQSHYFSVGPLVPWAEAGVGVVATQSLVRVDYGPRGLDAMRGGVGAADALAALLTADDNPHVRQVAMVDAQGGVAAHTGGKAIPFAGHQTGAQFSAQANLMANDRVWGAAADGFARAKGDLAARLLAGLAAAQAAGGDVRGEQSAALLVVRAVSTGQSWVDRVVDLRVEDHRAPVRELARLLRLRRAYTLEDEGDAHIAAARAPEALRAYAAAAKLAPEIVELRFWAAVSMYGAGKRRAALTEFREVFARERRWVALVPRLAQVGMFPAEADKIAEVVAQATSQSKAKANRKKRTKAAPPKQTKR